MRNPDFLLIAVLALVGLIGSTSLTAPLISEATEMGTATPELRPYRHPQLDIQFTAPVGWQLQARPEDQLIHEMADAATGIQVVLWYTTSEMSARRYLQKMASMLEVVVDDEPVSRTINGRQTWVLDLAGVGDAANRRTVLALLADGKSTDYPRENALYVIQIHCPADIYPERATDLYRILDSVRLNNRLIHDGKTYALYPETFANPPPVPSPLQTADGRQFVLAGTQSGRYALVDVTVENGGPQQYHTNRWNKGRQLVVDSSDFPTLARAGLHDPAELARATAITGRPVVEISASGQPAQASHIGFLDHDEEIIPVLTGDNRLVSRLGMTHRQLARPLFQLYNLTLRVLELRRRGTVAWQDIDRFLYHDTWLSCSAYGGKGWQESIFADEILGYFELEVSRELTPDETAFTRARYSFLGGPRLDHLLEKLSFIHTGEMVPFYIQRYGFYEGHTDYRADPLAIASVFGLRTVEELEAVFPGQLYAIFSQRYDGRASDR